MCIVIIENVQIPVVEIVIQVLFNICQPIIIYNYIWLIFCVVLITLLHGLLMMNVYSNCMLN